MNSRGRKSRRAGGLQSHLRDGKNHSREDQGPAERRGSPAAGAGPPPATPLLSCADWSALGGVRTAVSVQRRPAEPAAGRGCAGAGSDSG